METKEYGAKRFETKKYLLPFLKEQTPLLITIAVSCILIVMFYTIFSEVAMEVYVVIGLLLCCYIGYMGVMFRRYMQLHVNKEYQLACEETACSITTFQGQKKFFSLWIHSIRKPLFNNHALLVRLRNNEIDQNVFMRLMEAENRKLEGQLDLVFHMLRLQEYIKDYVPTTINLNEELNQLIYKNRNLFANHKIIPKIEQMDKPVMIQSDRKWNDMILLQLVTNAITYSSLRDKDTEKTIYFRILHEEDKVTLLIRDEGMGIPASDLPRVYEPFYTGANGRYSQKSSGMGLYFCNEVCQLLGHEMQIESKVGEGTTVMITYRS